LIDKASLFKYRQHRLPAAFFDFPGPGLPYLVRVLSDPSSPDRYDKGGLCQLQTATTISTDTKGARRFTYGSNALHEDIAAQADAYGNDVEPRISKVQKWSIGESAPMPPITLPVAKNLVRVFIEAVLANFHSSSIHFESR
jgi:hypothetical protein